MGNPALQRGRLVFLVSCFEVRNRLFVTGVRGLIVRQGLVRFVDRLLVIFRRDLALVLLGLRFTVTFEPVLYDGVQLFLSRNCLKVCHLLFLPFFRMVA